MAILDTSFIIDFLRGDEAAARLFDDLERSEPELVITAIVEMELLSGLVGAREEKAVERFLLMAHSLPFDSEAARRAALIEREMRAAGTPVGLKDLQIAASALSRGHIVVTRDRGFARIPGLRVLTY